MLFEYFMDWLKITQTHPDGGLRLVGDALITASDLATGELFRESPNMKRLEGSYSTKLSIRCDGYTVTVDGNPSRWGRPDNLFGLRTLDDAVAVYNAILAEYGLPPFTKNTVTGWIQGEDGRKATRYCNGARIQRVDWTRNLMVGKGNESAFLRQVSGQTLGKGKTPQLYANGQTVDWGRGSTLWYLKLYRKAADLRESIKKAKNHPELAREVNYLEKLINFCDENGVIREEKEFKRAFLERHNLQFYGQTTETDFLPFLQDIEHLIARLEMSTFDYETIADQLLENGVVKSRQAANATQGCALAWLHGQNLAETMGRSQYYEHKARLKVIGLDVSIPHDIARVPQIKRQREITVSTALPPSWYRMPKVPSHLRLVA